jgi:DNA-binding PadR family transcriptional regulator
LSLRHAILGLLSLRPATGYEVKQTFDRGLSLGWNASESQIYRAMHTIERDGYATVDVVEQDSLPSKRVFRITEQGLAELDRWLASGVGPRYDKDPFLLRFFFMDRLDRDTTRSILYERRDQVALDIEENEKVRRQYNDLRGHHHPRRLWWQMQVLDGSIQQQRAQLHWLDNLIAAVERDVPESIPEQEDVESPRSE